MGEVKILILRVDTFRLLRGRVTLNPIITVMLRLRSAWRWVRSWDKLRRASAQHVGGFHPERSPCSPLAENGDVKSVTLSGVEGW